MHFRSLVIFALALSFFSCATRPDHPQLKLSSASDYEAELDHLTQKQKIYDGFTNLMDLSATLVTTKLTTLQIDQNARIYQWSPEQYAAEGKTALEPLQKETQVFLSFFIPDKKYDDLSKPTTKWKIFLDSNGRRIEGRATKIKQQLAEIQSLYPHHTRWQSAYKVIFPIPLSLIENSESKLTLTGPFSSVSVDFKP